MRAVHLFAVSAALALGASLASVDGAPAQGLLEMAPADSSARVSQPRYEEVKFETDTAQPPKAGSAIIFPGRGSMGLLPPRKKAGKSADGTKAK